MLSAAWPAARQRPRPDAENFGGEVSWRSLPEMRAMRGLFPLNVRRLDDRPPPLDFGSLQSTEGFGRLLFARHDLLPELCELLMHGRISQNARDGGIELGDHRLGRPLGREQPAPD